MAVADDRIRSWGASNYIPYKGKMVKKPTNLNEITQYISRDDMLLYITEAFNREFFTEYIPDLVGANLVQTMTVNSPMISYMFESGFDAYPLGEGVEIPIAKPKYGKVTVRVQKFGVGVSITNEAIEDVQSFDVVSRQVQNGMNACARFEDKLIIQTLLNGVSDGTTNFKTGQQVSNHVLDATDTTFSGTSGVLDWEKIQMCLAVGQAEGIPYDTLVIHPYNLLQLMKMDQFMSSNVFQVLPPDQQQTFRTGNMYPIAGLNIISTPWMSTTKALFLNTQQYAIRFVRRPLSVDQESIISHDAMALYMTARVGVGVVNPDAACRLDNLTALDPANYVG